MKADRDSDWDPSDYDSGDDTPTSGARDRASNWCRYVKFYNGEKTEDLTRCVVILGQRSETGHRLATVLAVPDTGSTTSIIDVGLVERNGFTWNKQVGNLRLTGATGQDMKIYGTIWVTMKLCGSNYRIEVEAIVTEVDSQNLLIGRRDLQRMNVIGSNFPSQLSESAALIEECFHTEMLKEADRWPLAEDDIEYECCLLYTSPSPRDLSTSRMPSSA